MPPPDDTEPARRDEPAPPQGDAPGGPDLREEPQRLGILFFAAALALALLLTIIGLLAAAAMSRMPPDEGDPERAAVTTAERASTASASPL